MEQVKENTGPIFTDNQLPYFPQENVHLRSQIMQYSDRILLVEGHAGIGKGYCLKRISKHYYTALQIKHVLDLSGEIWNSSTSVLILDDLESMTEAYINVLFEKIQATKARMILCTSSKSMAWSLQKYSHLFRFICLEPVANDVVCEYLVMCINMLLEEVFKFTPESANLFVETFGGNMQEILRFMHF